MMPELLEIKELCDDFVVKTEQWIGRVRKMSRIKNLIWNQIENGKEDKELTFNERNEKSDSKER